jgi:OPA family glycerol-3-phosphate transporter-like MFS transporter
MGFPPIARGMTLWFPPQGKSWRWALWTCSHQAGTAAIMAFTAFILSWGTWRDCFWIPGVMCIVMGLALLWLLGDTPESRGLTSMKAFASDDAGAVAAPGEFRKAFVRHVLKNRNVWAIGLADLCVYVVRYGTLDWTTKYLVEVKGLPIGRASTVSSLIEFVGIPGMLLAGYISDRFFDARRAPVCFFYMLGLAAVVAAFFVVPAGHDLLDACAVGAIGFFTYGPQMLLAGVAAADACGAQVAAAAVGITGMMSYIGAIISSLGTGTLIDRFGWGGAFALWIGCALVGAALLLPLWRSRGRTR